MMQRDRLEAAKGSQSWKSVTSETWQPLSLESAVLIPAAWAALTAIPTALATGVGVGLLASPRAGIAVGAIVGGAVFGLVMHNGAQDAREVLLSREVYDAGQADAQGARASRETLLVEVVERDAGQTRMERNTFDVSREVLQIALGARLSKRGLEDAGVDSETALSLLARLDELGYTRRDAANRPASLTAKGRALARGVGAVVEV
jgi:hypothetical protein